MWWWAFGSMALWGIAGTASAIAARNSTALGAWAASTMVEFVIVLPLIMQARAAWSWATVVVGVTGGLAYGMFFLALKGGGDAAPIVAVTAMYPVVTAIMAWVLLGQELSVKQWVGVVLAVLASVLIVTE